MKTTVKIIIWTLFCAYVNSSESNVVPKILNYKENLCLTIVFAEGQVSRSENSGPVQTLLNLFGNQNEYFTSVNVDQSALGLDQEDFFGIEHSEDELIVTSKFTLRHTRPCNLVLITGSQHIGQALLTALFTQRITRSSHDYFVYIGDTKTSQDFIASSYASNLRYIYAVAIYKNETKYIKTCQGEMFSRKCDNMVNSKHLRIAASFGPQMLRYTRNPDGSISSGAGVYYQMLRESGLQLNFTFTIETVIVGGSGVKTNSGWTGTVGRVFNNEADIAVVIAFTHARNAILDPSMSVEWVHRTFFIRKPPVKVNWAALFPHLRGVVYLVAALFGVLVVILVYFAILQKILQNHPHRKHALRSRLAFILAVWSLFALVLGAAFRSKLMIFLAFLNSPEVPATHKELTDWGYTLYFRYYGGTAYQATKNSNSSVHKKILGRAVLVNTSFDCILAAGLTEKSACLDYDFHGQYAIYTNGSLYHDHREFFVKSTDNDLPFFMVWGYRKGSPLRETMDPLLYGYQESGLYSHWLDSDFRKSKAVGVNYLRHQKNSPLKQKIETVIEKDLSSAPKPLSLSNLLNIFLMFCAGLVVSLVLFFIERWYIKGSLAFENCIKLTQDIEKTFLPNLPGKSLEFENEKEFNKLEIVPEVLQIKSARAHAR